MSYWMPSADPTSPDEQRRLALGYITEAWIEAVKDGVDPDHMALATFEASIRELMALKGEAGVAALLSATVARLECGEFHPHVTRQ